MRDYFIGILISLFVFFSTVISLMYWLKQLIFISDAFLHPFKYSLCLGMFIVSATFLCAIIAVLYKKTVDFIID